MSQSSSDFAFQHLSIAERIALAQDILDSVAAEQEEFQLTEDEKSELDRRLANMEANPDAGCSWEEFRARLEAEL